MKNKMKALEITLSKVAGVDIEITFARTNLVTLAWDGEDVEAFNRLQEYFKGVLFDYEYDEEYRKTKRGGFKSPPPLLEQERIFRRTHEETTRT